MRAEAPAFGSVARARLAADAAVGDGVVESAVTRWALYLYVFWIPLEYPNRTLPFDLGTLAGSAFVLTTLISARACYRRLPAPVVCYGLFFYVWCASFVLNGGQYRGLFIPATLRLLQLILVFWASCNLLRNPRTARNVLVTLVVAVTVLALLQVTGVANAMSDLEDGVRRVTVLGQNANRTSRFLAGAALAVIGLTFGRARVSSGQRALAAGLVLLYVGCMVRGGSRGGMLTLAAGVLVFALSGRSLRAKLRTLGAAAVVMGALGYMALQSPLMQRRLALAQSGNLAKREIIFPTAWRMFTERPLVGWGPVRAYYELGERLPQEAVERRDTHNLVLDLLATTGVAGAVPALMALALSVLAAWRARGGAFGLLPVAFLAQVFTGNMSGNFLAFKLYWVFQALAVATAPTLAAHRARRLEARSGRPAVARPARRGAA